MGQGQRGERGGTATAWPDAGPWHEIANVDEVASPALAFYPDRIEENIRRMIRIAGRAERLRPHVKTHKCAEIVRLQLAQGIRAFKCSTIAEAEMAAAAGAPDVLLAMQPVGPAIGRFLALQREYPATAFGAIADAERVIAEIGRAASEAGTVARLWLDVNSGMNRTGIAPGAEAARLYGLIHAAPGLRAGGLHVYDGHIHEPDPAARAARCDAEFAPVARLIDALAADGLPVPAVVAGGSPTFPIHAKRAGVELSPGTPLLWDAGYGRAYPDLDFLVSAVLVSRVVSKPAGRLVCLDLGTKAVASEMPQPRAVLLGIGEHRVAAHNEEHLVIEVPDPDRYQPGGVVYAVPIHICPTVARYETAHVVRNGRRAGEWTIAARNRRITI
ncbi:MAG TPA: D-TA family PLP-dependent enzyme [Vicinamibacterales bacterium]|nr:D-TA family PLP-dependent enzyme [Vicinamibacterales bacterium]HPW20394.1 D-TA family PLP-dependent enzyme [Vicinamibacterales bacterium]